MACIRKLFTDIEFCLHNDLTMSNKKITELPAAGALTGAELVETVQGGINVQTTSGGVSDPDTTAVALVDDASMAMTGQKHTLYTSSVTRTFTITYTGDDITLVITLSAATSTLTFPATSLCVSEGVASGDNTCPLAGVSGDKYVIAIKKVGSAYYVVCKNFGQ